MPGDRNTTHGRRRLWRTAAVLAALVAVALPVSGALAGGGADGGGSTADPPDAGAASIQTQERRQDDRRHDGDCPGKDRGQDGTAGGATDGSVEL